MWRMDISGKTGFLAGLTEMPDMTQTFSTRDTLQETMLATV
jgi:hypothetical protein